MKNSEKVVEIKRDTKRSFNAKQVWAMNGQIRDCDGNVIDIYGIAKRLFGEESFKMSFMNSETEDLSDESEDEE